MACYSLRESGDYITLCGARRVLRVPSLPITRGVDSYGESLSET